MSEFALLHLAAFLAGAFVGLLVRPRLGIFMGILYLIGFVGLVVAAEVATILSDPRGGSGAGGEADLFFIYGIMFFAPLLVVLPLLFFGGFTAAQLTRAFLVAGAREVVRSAGEALTGDQSPQLVRKFQRWRRGRAGHKDDPGAP